MRFKVGDTVRTHVLRRSGHTRLPAYLVGRLGRVVAVAGPYALSDERATGGEFSREHVYAVRFDADGVWDHPAGGGSIIADLFESYLDHA